MKTILFALTTFLIAGSALAATNRALSKLELKPLNFLLECKDEFVQVMKEADWVSAGTYSKDDNGVEQMTYTFIRQSDFLEVEKVADLTVTRQILKNAPADHPGTYFECKLVKATEQSPATAK